MAKFFNISYLITCFYMYTAFFVRMLEYFKYVKNQKNVEKYQPN